MNSKLKIAYTVLCMVLMLSIGVAAQGCSTYSLTVSASPDAVCYGGSTSTVTATVKINNVGVSGHVIQFTVSGPASPGSVSPTSATTNSSGVATTTYTSGSNGGTVTITAKDTSQAGQPTATCTIKVIKVLHQTEATIPADRTRTTIGLHEGVNCWTEGNISVTWEASGGGFVWPGSGASTTFVAPQSPATPTVHAKLGTADCTQGFTVIAPNGMTSVLTSDNPLGVAGPPNNQIGARSVFTCTVLPTTVSFYNASFRENISRQTWNWPDTTQGVRDAAIVPWTPAMDNTIPDTVSSGLNPIGRIWDGQSYVDFNINILVPEEYENEAGGWTSWLPTELHPRQYQGVDQAARVKLDATNLAIGGWQGPYQ